MVNPALDGRSRNRPMMMILHCRPTPSKVDKYHKVGTIAGILSHFLYWQDLKKVAKIKEMLTYEKTKEN